VNRWEAVAPIIRDLAKKHPIYALIALAILSAPPLGVVVAAYRFVALSAEHAPDWLAGPGAQTDRAKAGKH